ncbi:MAG: histidinol-phosphate aminotransferase family protein [Anaerolineae bacterium]|nr:histidinol-phosphate aminotransferase family protein [Anaerolineae bacterium]
MKDTITPRSDIVAVPLDQHGDLDYVELEAMGCRPDDVLDFSANINPYGPPPGVREAIAAAPIERYPDRETLALRRALSEQHSMPIEQIVAGNGAAELIWLATFAFIRPQDTIVVVGPTFGEYARCAALMGGRVQIVSAKAENDFIVSPEKIEQALKASHPRLAFICNPNNPTGTAIDPGLIAGWAAAHPATLFIIDEAYLDFTTGVTSTLQYRLPNILSLHSMTKTCAMAGLRLGYALGPQTIIDAISRARPPWSVNVVAQAAGLAALADTQHVRAAIGKLQQAKEELVDGLAGLGLSPVPSMTHYFLVDVGGGAQFRHRLLARRIQVRDCASFGLPAYARIAARRPEENAQLLAAIEKTGNEETICQPKS